MILSLIKRNRSCSVSEATTNNDEKICQLFARNLKTATKDYLHSFAALTTNKIQPEFHKANGLTFNMQLYDLVL